MARSSDGTLEIPLEIFGPGHYLLEVKHGVIHVSSSVTGNLATQ